MSLNPPKTSIDTTKTKSIFAYKMSQKRESDELTKTFIESTQKKIKANYNGNVISIKKTNEYFEIIFVVNNSLSEATLKEDGLTQQQLSSLNLPNLSEDKIRIETKVSPLMKYFLKEYSVEYGIQVDE